MFTPTRPSPMLIPDSGPPTLTPEDVEKLLMQSSFEAGMALFSAYDVDLHPMTGNARDRCKDLNLISIIGFAGRQLSGSLVLGSSEEPLTLSMPRGSTGRGWIAELANQLLGRMKNKVLARGIEFYAMPPAVVSGTHLAIVTSRP